MAVGCASTTPSKGLRRSPDMRPRRPPDSIATWEGEAGECGASTAGTGETKAGFEGTAWTACTGARKRYPRRACVSTNRGESAESPSACRSFFMALFRLWSKSTNVSSSQSLWRNRSRGTTSPGCSSNSTRIRNGFSRSLMRMPCLRSSPTRRSTWKGPKLRIGESVSDPYM